MERMHYAYCLAACHNVLVENGHHENEPVTVAMLKTAAVLLSGEGDTVPEEPQDAPSGTE